MTLGVSVGVSIVDLVISVCLIEVVDMSGLVEVEMFKVVVAVTVSMGVEFSVTGA